MLEELFRDLDHCLTGMGRLAGLELFIYQFRQSLILGIGRV